MDLQKLIEYAKEHSASDIHLVPSHPPIIRIHGDIKQIRIDTLTEDYIKDVIYAFMSKEQIQTYERDMEFDFSINIPQQGRCRVNLFNGVYGTSAALRVIPETITPLQEMNLRPSVQKLAMLDQGLVLITGSTGSGKSTTLASLIDAINSTKYKHIITIEDPIEFKHYSKKSLINQREVNTHTKSFNNALKSALREDPDIILIGELRDIETIRLALSAAETGHLVFSTLHTNSAAKSIDRIIDVFPVGEKEMVRSMLSSTIAGIVSQKLLKKRDNSGRVVAHEVLIATPAIRNLIRENKIPQINSLIQTNSKEGMLSMEECVKNLLKEGIISSEEAASTLKEQDIKSSTSQINDSDF